MFPCSGNVPRMCESPNPRHSLMHCHPITAERLAITKHTETERETQRLNSGYDARQPPISPLGLHDDARQTGDLCQHSLREAHNYLVVASMKRPPLGRLCAVRGAPPRSARRSPGPSCDAVASLCLARTAPPFPTLRAFAMARAHRPILRVCSFGAAITAP